MYCSGLIKKNQETFSRWKLNWNHTSDIVNKSNKSKQHASMPLLHAAWCTGCRGKRRCFGGEPETQWMELELLELNDTDKSQYKSFISEFHSFHNKMYTQPHNIYTVVHRTWRSNSLSSASFRSFRASHRSGISTCKRFFLGFLGHQPKRLSDTWSIIPCFFQNDVVSALGHSFCNPKKWMQALSAIQDAHWCRSTGPACMVTICYQVSAKPQCK